MAKILFINLPTHGHVNPTLAITKELVDRGHEVTYLNSEEFKDKIEATGAKLMEYDEKVDFSALVQELLPELPNIYRNIYKTAMRIGKDFDCIIYEMVFLPGSNLGKKLNKPTIQIFSTFAFNENMVGSIYNQEDKGFEFIKQRISSVFSDKSLFGDTPNMGFLVADLNIVCTTRKFQIGSESFDDEKYKFVGPSVIERKEKFHIDFDKLKDKIIYISLGTIFNDSLEFFKKCINAFKDVDASVIMSIGKNINIEELGSIPDNFLVRDFIPQLEVLKKAHLFITHGGMNSANEAMYYAVPVITIPQSVDQPAVAKQMEDLGLGKVIDKNNISVENLKNTANEVLHNNIYKENMINMSKDMINAGGYKKAVDEIENYIKAKL